MSGLQERENDLVLQHEVLRKNDAQIKTVKKEKMTLQAVESESPTSEMQDVLFFCQSPMIFVQAVQSLTRRVEIDSVEGSLLNTEPSDSNCNNVRTQFKRYIELFEESTRLLNVLANGSDGDLSEANENPNFTKDNESTLAELQKVLDAMASTYPDRRFNRDKEHRLHWKADGRSPIGGFFDYSIVRFGPNTWESSWDMDLRSQDWVLSEPAFKKNGDLTFSLKASVHDVCIDKRRVLLVGYLNDSSLVFKASAP